MLHSLELGAKRRALARGVVGCLPAKGVVQVVPPRAKVHHPAAQKCCQHGILRHNPSTTLQATSRAVMPLAPRTQHLEAASLPGRQCVPSLQQRQLPSGPFAPEAVFRQLAKRMPLPQCTPRRANGAAQVNTSFQAGCPSILSGAYYGSSVMKAWPAAAHASQACPLQQLAAVQPAAKKQPKTI